MSPATNHLQSMMERIIGMAGDEAGTTEARQLRLSPGSAGLFAPAGLSHRGSLHRPPAAEEAHDMTHDEKDASRQATLPGPRHPR
jgi:hypothetical protein